MHWKFEVKLDDDIKKVAERFEQLNKWTSGENWKILKIDSIKQRSEKERKSQDLLEEVQQGRNTSAMAIVKGFSDIELRN